MTKILKDRAAEGTHKSFNNGASEHTPGSWAVGHAGFERTPVVVARRAGRPVTVARCGGNDDEDEANARLIAAAPDLLEALKEIDEAEAAYEGNVEDDERCRAALAKGRAAIAKAEGK